MQYADQVHPVPRQLQGKLLARRSMPASAASSSQATSFSRASTAVVQRTISAPASPEVLPCEFRAVSSGVRLERGPPWFAGLALDPSGELSGVGAGQCEMGPGVRWAAWGCEMVPRAVLVVQRKAGPGRALV